MECKKIQSWLMTDYLDRQLDPQKNTEVERHLNTCPACREFLEGVRKTTLVPFKEAELQPDPIVWQRIQERIEAKKVRSEGWFEKLADILAPFVKLSLPAFRIALVTAVVLAVVWLGRWPSSDMDPAYAYIEEQAAFLGELQAGNPDFMNGDLGDYDVLFEDPEK